MLTTLCCLNSECLKSSCKPCTRCFGLTINHQVKLAYFLLVTVIVAVALILKTNIKDPSAYILRKTGCEEALLQNNCVFSQVTIRMFFCLCIMFIGFAGAMSLRNDKAKVINEGIWLMKLAVFLLLFSVSLLLGPGIIDFIYRSCLQCWLLYCLIQSTAVIDLLWSFAVAVKERLEEQRSTLLQIVSILLTLGSYSAAITLNVYEYNWLPKWLAVCNSVAIGLLFVAALVNINPNNTILLSGMVLLYLQCLSYILGMACLDTTTFKYKWTLEAVMLMLLGLLFLGMLHRGSGRIKTNSASVNHLIGLTTERSEEAGYVTTNNWRKFHLLMAVVCMSLPVLLTQWRHITQDNEDTFKETLPKVYSGISLLAAYLLYIWSIVCIRCYPDRDLSELESYFKEFELN